MNDINEMKEMKEILNKRQKQYEIISDIKYTIINNTNNNIDCSKLKAELMFLQDIYDNYDL
jgi:hypothetical protein